MDGGTAVAAGIGGAVEAAVLPGKALDASEGGMVAVRAWFDFDSALLEVADRGGRYAGFAEERGALAVESWGGDGFLGRHTEIDEVDDGLKYGGGDGPASGRSDDDLGLAVFEEDRRCQGTGSGASGIEGVVAAGFGVHEADAVVPGEAGARDDDAAVAGQGVGEGDAVAVVVHGAEVGRASGFHERLLVGELAGADRFGQLAAVLFGDELVDRDVFELGVGQVIEAGDGGPGECAGQGPGMFGAVVGHPAEIKVFEGVEHFEEHDAAGGQG